jgi:hypothetical protein
MPSERADEQKYPTVTTLLRLDPDNIRMDLDRKGSLLAEIFENLVNRRSREDDADLSLTISRDDQRRKPKVEVRVNRMSFPHHQRQVAKRRPQFNPIPRDGHRDITQFLIRFLIKEWIVLQVGKNGNSRRRGRDQGLCAHDERCKKERVKDASHKGESAIKAE